MGCDDYNLANMALQNVSIHAPAWGATQGQGLTNKIIKVSIHAPAWGATSTYAAVLNVYKRFNPRTRMGCDATQTVRQ